jgi:hypothetical protein
VLGAQFIVSQPLPRLVMFVGATLVHELCYQAVTALIESRGFRLDLSAALMQAFVNGFVGVVAFLVVEQAPGLAQRRQARGTLSRRY